MIPGLAPPESGSAKEALGFFRTAFAFLLLGTLALVLNSAELASGSYASPRVIGGLHLITLGWLSLSIFGALQVFLGVALGSVPHANNLPLLLRWTWTLGTGLFALGLGFHLKGAALAGISFIVIGLVFFSIQQLPALWNAKRGHLTRGFAAISILSLWLIWILGAAAALSRFGTHAMTLPPGYLSAHILIAVFGWVGSMIVGVGSHLVPMFALSKTTSTLPVKLALPLWALIPVLGVVSAFEPDPWQPIAWSLAAAGSLLWCVQLLLFVLSRMRREKDPGLLLAFLATAFLPLAWMGFLVWREPLPFVGTLIFGWLTLFTLGIYHRVIPFLVWFLRFSTHLGKIRPPRVKDLVDERLASASAFLGSGGVALWAVGLSVGHTALVLVGAIGLFLACICAGAQIRTLYQEVKS